MLLTAIKEMQSGKGTSVNAIFTYIRSTYGYDLFKNRTHTRKTLAKLINEGLVEQVKGRGLAGSFRLGKNYKETKKMLAVASKFVRIKSFKGKYLMQKYYSGVLSNFCLFFNVRITKTQRARQGKRFRDEPKRRQKQLCKSLLQKMKVIFILLRLMV